MLIGAAATAADMNGAAKASHIKDKLIEMTHLNETLFSCGLACSYEGVKMPAGNYQIDMLLANVCKQNVTRFPYEIARLAEDIAGGLMVTMPSEKDLRSEKVGKRGREVPARRPPPSGAGPHAGPAAQSRTSRSAPRRSATAPRACTAPARRRRSAS